jgi:hypothetical protein
LIRTCWLSFDAIHPRRDKCFKRAGQIESTYAIESKNGNSDRLSRIQLLDFHRRTLLAWNFGKDRSVDSKVDKTAST